MSLAWAQDYLSSRGYAVQDNPQVIRIIPWSVVTCLPTTKGLIYLKSMAKPFSIEPILLQFLSDQISTCVTQIIAVNNQLSCFLMKDAGEPLRNKLKLHFKPELLRQALKICADIQISAIDHADELIMTGVNDWRLEKLPSLYQDFVTREDLLKNDGLVSFEIENLQQSICKIQNLCEQLAEYKIPETIEHGDFQDNNILINGSSITISDWGDASISHPFFSCVSALNSTNRHHHLRETDSQYQAIQNSYLAQWKAYGTEDKLLKAFKLAQKIRYFVFALSVSRIKSCPSIELFPEYKGYIAESLRNFIKQA